jgi:D-amino-acid oxidase
MAFKNLREKDMILKKISQIIVVISIFANLANAKDLEVRKITPPQLNAGNLGQQVLCYRPMRQGSPAMNIEVKDDKIIANNYGHGGAGWTLGPGAAKYVVDMLKREKEVNKHTPIAIVGAGTLGLFNALELVNQGFKDITVIAEFFDDLTSHKAGGLLAPVSIDSDPESQKIIEQIGIESYKFYKKIALKKNKQLTAGATIMTAYYPNRENSDLEPYVGKVMQAAKDVILDFQNGTSHQMVAYDDGIFMDTMGLMNSLKAALDQAKVKFIQKKITNFAEIEQKVIFNCTGNGAKELSKDNKMISVQGHLIMLKNQNPQNCNYMIVGYSSQGQTKNNQTISRTFYFFPKRAMNANDHDLGVIGGTFVKNADSSTPNLEEFAIVANEARKFYGLAEQEVLPDTQEASKA